MTASSKEKISLDMLKRLVSELETALKNSDAATDPMDYVVEMNKAAGMASGISQEAILLVGDVAALLRLANTPQKPSGILEDLIKPLKTSDKGNKN